MEFHAGMDDWTECDPPVKPGAETVTLAEPVNSVPARGTHEGLTVGQAW